MESRSSNSLFSTVRSLPNDRSIKEKFARHKLTIGFVKWEDNARTKDSVWGPVISDVTLDVNETSFPIIGTENFKDPTFDMSIDRFSVNVGNETLCAIGNERPLQRISFKEYLQNIEKYISSTVKGSMYLPRDEKILTSAQSSILPLKDGEVPFNVRIHNYQYDEEDPAVLVIIASPHGTSAQLLTDYKQKIYFNKCGRKAPYVAKRLQDVRASEGKSLEGAMNQEEKEHNVLFVFQIPLKQKETVRRFKECTFSCSSQLQSASMPKMMSLPTVSRGMDHAQLSVGDSVGPWTGTSPKYILERDARYPIRCTIQYYRVTDSADIPDDVIEEITQQVWKFYEDAPTGEKGSLVVNSPSGRLTEPILPSKPITSAPFFSF